MQRSEIAKHFDEIVEFSDVKEFIEIPVKRYSSGMYTRLAFAVAAHLSTEILLLDEVLAVGDAGFQKKCLGRIGQVAGDGRTIIFVSHNLQAVRSTCQRVLWLDHGQVRACGATELVLADYLRSYSAGVDEVGIAAQIAALPEDQAICLLAVVVEQDGVLNGEPVTGKPINIRIDYRVLRETHGLRVYVVLHDIEGTPLFRSFAFGEDDVLPTLGPGHYRSCTSIPADLLAPIPYRLQISAAVHNQRHCFPFGVSVPLHVREAGRLRHAYSSSGMIGVKLAPVLSWNTERVSERTER